MKIWILSSDSESFSTKALSNLFIELGHEMQVVDPLKVALSFNDESMEIANGLEAMPLPDLVLPRFGWKSRDFGLSLALALESQGIRLVNSADGILRASHKLQSLLELRKNKIPVPDFHFQFSENSSPYPSLGNEKTIFKQYFGSQGFGTTWSESPGQRKSLIDLMRNSSTPFFIQKYLSSEQYLDIRCFFLEDDLIASFKRTSGSHDLRSNLHQGGQHEKFAVSDEVRKIALKAHQVFNLKYSAVDLLVSAHDIRILEVNPCPGLRGIAEHYGQEVLKEISLRLTKMSTFKK